MDMDSVIGEVASGEGSEVSQKKFDTDSYIKELQELRRDIATLHNHKEAVAYTAFSLNLAGVTWLATRSDPGPLLLLSLAASSILLHMLMRYQLIQRWHCTQFYQVYREAILELLVLKGPIEMKEITVPPPATPGGLNDLTKFIFWTRDQAQTSATYNYPTTELLHKKILKYTQRFSSDPESKDGRKNAIVEKIPTLGSLGCIFFIIVYSFIAALDSHYRLPSNCLDVRIQDKNSVLKGLDFCTR